jgi:hypothetical protein
MKTNIGNADKVLRIVVGFALVTWAVTGGPTWAWLGLVALATGITGVCPAYSILGINTCASKK